MSTFVIACGGTGGHLAPGISLAEKLIEEGHQCWLLISRKEVDSRLIAHYPDLNFVRAPGIPFSRNPFGFLKFALVQLKSVFFSLNLISNFRPDAVIGFGGFLTLGVGFASFVRRIPLVLHEANHVPGRSIRFLKLLARRIYLPDGVKISGVRARNIRYYGYPVRKGIQRAKSVESARRRLGIETRGKLLVVVGGSQGAAAMNAWVHRNFEVLADSGINVLCLTGVGKSKEKILERKSKNGDSVKAYFIPFSDQMQDVLSSADIAVSRAGAGSIAEITRCRVPSIFVPYPYSADRHQAANARFMEDQGAGVFLDQSNIEGLVEEVKSLIFNDWLLEKIRRNLSRLDRVDTLDLMANDLGFISSKAKDYKLSNKKEKTA